MHPSVLALQLTCLIAHIHSIFLSFVILESALVPKSPLILLKLSSEKTKILSDWTVDQIRGQDHMLQWRLFPIISVFLLKIDREMGKHTIQNVLHTDTLLKQKITYWFIQRHVSYHFEQFFCSNLRMPAACILQTSRPRCIKRSK